MTDVFDNPQVGDAVAVYGARPVLSRHVIARVTLSTVVLSNGARFGRRTGRGIRGASGSARPWRPEDDNMLERMHLASALTDALRDALKSVDRVAPETGLGVRFSVNKGCEVGARDVLAGLQLASGTGLCVHLFKLRVGELLTRLLKEGACWSSGEAVVDANDVDLVNGIRTVVELLLPGVLPQAERPVAG